MHKKYIRRGGRKFGPYYYTTIRDKNGKVCSYYLSRDPEEARIKEQELKARELKSRTQSRVQIPLRPIIALLLVVCALAAVFTGLNMTGLVISGEVLSYTQDLDVTAEQPQTLDWQLEEAPESFHVQSVKLSGSLIGNGSARVYIENPSGERYTVFDSESVRTSGLDITGYVIAEPPAEPELTETLPEEPELPEETSEEETPPPEEGQPPEEPEPPTEPETLPEEPVPAEDTAGPGPVIAEPKNATTPETPEENATAPEPPEENITIPENETNITLPEENVTLPENETNITLPEENITIPENETNITLPEENVTLPENETNVTVPENQTNMTNDTEELGPEIMGFEAICRDTCFLRADDGFTSGSYTLVIEVDPGTALVLDQLDYTLKNTTEIGEELTYTKLKDDPEFDIVVDSMAREAGDLVITFHHTFGSELPIRIGGRIEHVLSQNVSVGGEQVTLIVPDWRDQYFRLVVGSRTEVLAFGTPQEFGVPTTIRDARGDAIRASIEFIDSLTEDIEQRAESAPAQPGPMKAPAAALSVPEGVYNVRILPQAHPIKEIVLEDVEIEADLTKLISIDDVPESGGYVEVYAIDPTALNFTSAAVTVTAKGTELYKCQDWDFSAQECLGSWELFKKELVPGQEYSFSLTPEDPAFAETLQPNATEGIDTFVNKNAPNANYGSQTFLAAGESGGKYAGILIKFNVSNVPSSANITSAELKLYFYDSPTNPTNPINLSTRLITSDWNESSVTWNTRPSYSSQYSDKVTLTNSYGWVEWDIAAAVQGWVNGSYTNRGIAIIPDTGTASTDKRFYSSDHSNESLRPILDINYTTGEAPNTSVIWPENNTQHGNGKVIVAYNVTGGDGAIANCSVINSNNNNIIDTGNSITKNTLQKFTRIINQEGTYRVHINCTDSQGNTGSSEAVTFSVNASKADVHGKITDANGSTIDATIKFYQGGQEKFNSTGDLHALVVDDGLYNITINPNSFVVQNTSFKNVNITSGLIRVVDMDLIPAEEVPSLGNFSRVYAIDPTALNFTEATVTIDAATSNALYKCADWNFTTQTCSGTWVKFYDMIPGQSYTFTMTPGDPGYAETNISTYYLFDAADPQYAAYKQLQNATVGGVRYTSAAINQNLGGTQCWTDKWIAPNWTVRTWVNGTWNFSIYGYCDPGANAAYLLANIIKYNGTEYSILNTTASAADLCADTSDPGTANAWSYDVPYSADINLSVGERIGVQICVSISATKNKDMFIQWEETTASNVQFPNSSFIEVDNPPAVDLNFPPEAYNSSSATISFNWTATDDADATLYCNLTIDGTLNASDIASSNATPTNYSVSGLAEGLHYWNVTCRDSFPNTNTSETRSFTVDTTFPLTYYNPTTTAEGTYSQTFIFVNITCSDTSRHTVILNWNGTNESFASSSGDHFWSNKTGLSDGAYSFYGWCNDTVANANVTATRTVTLDTTPLDITIDAPADGSWHQATSVDLNVTTSESADWCGYSINGSANTTMTGSGTDWDAAMTLSEGENAVTVSCNDTVDNMNSSAVTVYVDLTDPVVSTTFPTPNLYVSYAPNITGTATETNLANCTTNLTEYNTTETSSPFNFTNQSALSEQVYDTLVTCADLSGRTGTDTVTWTYDVTNPLTYYNPTTTAEGTYSQDSIFVNITCSDTSRHTVILNWNGTNESFASSSGDHFWSNKTSLSDGAYAFYGWCNDSATNANVTDTRTITLDTDPPDITIDAPADGSWHQATSVDLNVTTSETASWCGYSINGSVNTTMTGSGTDWDATMTLSEGENAVTVSCNDTVDNMNSTSITVYVDLTDPVVSITFPTPNLYVSYAPNITGTATETNLANCTTNLTEYNTTETSSPFNFTNQSALSEQVYDTLVTCADLSGRTGTDTVTWTYDITLPQLYIYLPQNTTYDTTSLSLNYSSSDTNLNTTWYEYNSTNTTLSGNTTFTALDDQQSTLTLWANDSAGNTNSTLVTFTVDTTFPLTYYNPTTTAEGTYSQDSIFVNITCSDINRQTVILNWNGTNESFASSSGDDFWSNKTGLSDGAYAFYGWCNDSAANANATDTWTVTLDTTPPDITIDAPADGSWHQATSVDLNVTTSESADWCGYSINGSANTTMTGSGTDWDAAMTLSEGENAVTVFCNDTANNMNSSAVTVYVDLTDPVVSITFPTSNLYVSYAPNITGTATETNLANCTTNLTEYNTTETSSPFNFTNQSALSEQVYDTLVTCADLSGRTGTDTVTWTYDTTPPAWSNNATSPASGTAYSQGASYQFNVTWTDAGIGMDTVLIEHNFTGALGNYTVANISSVYYYDWTDLPAGYYVWREFANDSLGNINSTDQWIYEVARATSTCSLVFDKASPQIYGTQINASCACTSPEASAQLYRDGDNVTSENNQLVTLGAGTYNYTCNVSQTQNYTFASNSTNFTINPNYTVLNLTASPSWSETYGTQTTVNCTANNAEVSPQLYRDGALVENTSYDTAVLGGGTWNYTCNNTATQNWTANSTSNNLTISPAASEVNLTLDGRDSNITVQPNTTVNLTAYMVTPATGYIELYRNGTLINNGSSPLSNLSDFNDTGEYNITAIYPATENYSYSYETHWVIVVEFAVEILSPTQASPSTDRLAGQTLEIQANVTQGPAAFIGENMTFEARVGGTSCPITSNVSDGSKWDINCTLPSKPDGQYYDLWLNGTYSDNGFTDTDTETNAVHYQDLTAPNWTSNATSPANNSAYSPGQAYQFNVTWTDNVAVDTMLFEHDFNGTLLNYTASGNVSSEYFYNWTGLPAGTYTWRSHANDTADNWNQTDTWAYTVQRATSTCSLTFNPASPIDYSNTVNVSCACTSPEAPAQLYRDGDNVTSENNQLILLGASTYNYTCNVSQTQNYTFASNSSLFVVNPLASEVNLTLNGTDGNRTIETGEYLNITAYLVTPATGYIELYRNGTLINSGQSPLNNLTQFTTLGLYNITALYPATQNYSSSYETHWVTVQDTIPPQIALTNPANNTNSTSQGHDFNFTATDNYWTTLDCSLYINSVLSGSNSSTANNTLTNITNTSVPEGINAWWINCTDGSYNSNVSEERALTIDFTAPNITIINPTQGAIVGYNVTLDADITDNIIGVDSAWYEISNASGVQASGTLTAPGYTDVWDSSTVADGGYTFTVYSNDTLGNQANASVNFSVDNSYPYIEIVVPQNSSVWNANFTLNITVQDGGQVNSSRYNITNSTGQVVQSNINTSIGATFFSWKDLVDVDSLPSDNYTLEVYAEDNVGLNATKVHIFYIDKIAPIWSNNQTSPANNSVYSPIQVYQFSVTWTDPRLDAVLFEHDFSGALYNYSPSGNVGSNYYYTWTGLPAGTYTWRSWANDTPGNLNGTDTWAYTVQRATSTCSLTFNPASPIDYSNTVNVSCACTSPEAPAQLYRDGDNVTSENNQLILLGASTYNYTCNVSQTQNYTFASNSSLFVVNPLASEVNLTLNGTDGNFTMESGDQVNITAYLVTPSTGYIEVYKDGGLINAGQSPLSNVMSFTIGAYNITALYPATQNYSYSYETHWVNVVPDAMPPSVTDVTAIPNPVKQGQTTTITANITDAKSNVTSAIAQVEKVNGTVVNRTMSKVDSVWVAFYTPSINDTLGDYNVTIIANDTYGNVNGTEKIALTVVYKNVAPVLDPIPNQTVNETDIVFINATGSDANNDTLTFYYASPFNSSGYWQTRYDSAGTWLITVTISDGELNDTQDVVITVNDDPANVSINLTFWYAGDDYDFNLTDSGIKVLGVPVNRSTTGNTTEGLTQDLVILRDFYDLLIDMVNNTVEFNSVNITGNVSLIVYLTAGLANLTPESYITFTDRSFAAEPQFTPESGGQVCFDLTGVSFTDADRKAIFSCDWSFGGSACNGSWTTLNTTTINNSLCANVSNFSAFVLGETMGYCGDGTCDPTESCSSCPADCGACPPPEAPAGVGAGAGAPPPVPTCTEDWICTDWGPCVVDVKTRTCTDRNECGTVEYKPAEETACMPPPCVENWICTDWGPCINNTQARRCTDLSKCGTVHFRPVEEGYCLPPAALVREVVERFPIELALLFVAMVGGALGFTGYQTRRLKEIAERQREEVPKMVKRVKKAKPEKKKEVAVNAEARLLRQLELLDKAFDMGYISEDVYDKSRRRVKAALKEIRPK